MLEYFVCFIKLYKIQCILMAKVCKKCVKVYIIICEEGSLFPSFMV